MSSFTVTREVRAPAPELWSLLVDWPRHGAWVPFTSLHTDAGQGHAVGSVFVGRTAIGRVGFDDPMRVIAWRPPSGTTAGRVRVRHEGTVVVGEAEIEVRPVTGARCVASWYEDIRLLPGLPSPLARAVELLGGPANVLGGRLIFGRVLRRAADQAEQAHAIASGAV